MSTPVTSAGRYAAACSSLIWPALAGPDRPARWLGVSASALYLELARGPVVDGPVVDGPVVDGPVVDGPVVDGPVVDGPVVDGPVVDGPVVDGPVVDGPVVDGPVVDGPVVDGPVVAVLASDAVRLPCGVLLPRDGTESPLTRLVAAGSDRDAAGGAVAGGGAIRWNGPSGPVTLGVVRRWAPARVAAGELDRSAFGRFRDLLAGTWKGIGVEWRFADALALVAASAYGRADGGEVTGVVLDLLGRGPGLTPAGDDLLAGYLIGVRAFGADSGSGADRAGDDLAKLVRDLAGGRTTALSAQLLGYAADGYCVDQAAATVAALAGRGDIRGAADRLLAVGHSSGAALAWGLLLAAEAAE